MLDMASYELIPHGFSIFDYVRKYDPEWIAFLNKLRDFVFFELRTTEKESRTARVSSTKPYLPLEIIFQIMVFLDASALVAASRVSKDWKHLSTRDCLWEGLLIFQFRVSSSQTLRKNNYSRNKKKTTRKMENGKKECFECFSPYEVYKTMHHSYLMVARANVRLLSNNIFVPSSFLSS
jgi:hypothetical protein